MNYVCREGDSEAQPLEFDGTIDGLNDYQLHELYEHALCDIYESLGLGTPSYGELADAESYVSRAMLDSMFGDVVFVPEDFSSPCQVVHGAPDGPTPFDEVPAIKEACAKMAANARTHAPTIGASAPAHAD